MITAVRPEFACLLYIQQIARVTYARRATQACSGRYFGSLGVRSAASHYTVWLVHKLRLDRDSDRCNAALVQYSVYAFAFVKSLLAITSGELVYTVKLFS